jgi:hypothetical protein
MFGLVREVEYLLVTVGDVMNAAYQVVLRECLLMSVPDSTKAG